MTKPEGKYVVLVINLLVPELPISFATLAPSFKQTKRRVLVSRWQDDRPQIGLCDWHFLQSSRSDDQSDLANFDECRGALIASAEFVSEDAAIYANVQPEPPAAGSRANVGGCTPS